MKVYITSVLHAPFHASWKFNTRNERHFRG